MQNSGLGNAVNPLLSLSDPEVYGFPLILMIGWRGKPGDVDEPQHVKQGRVTPDMLDVMQIPYRILDENSEEVEPIALWSVETSKRRSGPVGLLVKKGTFSKNANARVLKDVSHYKLEREKAIECIIERLPPTTIVVATTGKISRELYELRKRKKQKRDADFLTVGSMGHASQIAFGISVASPDKQVVCLDGDGAAIMHMGGLTSIGSFHPLRLIHIILNNGAHESVGGQPTVGFKISLTDVAKAVGYRTVLNSIEKEDEIDQAVRQLLLSEGPAFLEIRLSSSSRSDLGRPEETPKENKRLFMGRLIENK
jgi:phosphonopyruvate decarboxylase